MTLWYQQLYFHFISHNRICLFYGHLHTASTSLSSYPLWPKVPFRVWVQTPINLYVKFIYFTPACATSHLFEVWGQVGAFREGWTCIFKNLSRGVSVFTLSEKIWVFCLVPCGPSGFPARVALKISFSIDLLTQESTSWVTSSYRIWMLAQRGLAMYLEVFPPINSGKTKCFLRKVCSSVIEHAALHAKGPGLNLW